MADIPEWLEKAENDTTQISLFNAMARRTDPDTSHIVALTSEEHPLRARSRLPPETCDCCGGKVKLYRRKLNSGMARTLCWLTVKDAKEPGCWVSAVDMPEKVEQYATELGKLDFWGLVSRRCNPDGSSYKESQQWCITTKGIQFARGKTEAPSHIFLQSPDNRIFGFEASTVGVRAALGKHFDYHDLMRGE